MAQAPEASAEGAQLHVGPDSPPLNLQNTSNDLEEGAQPSAGLVLQQNDIPEDSSNIQGGSNAPIMTTAATATQAPQVNLAAQDHVYYRPLYLFAQRGDWKRAKSFIEHDPSALTARITDYLDTILLVAAKSCQWEFMLKLLELLSPELIAMRDIFGLTALQYVAQAGNCRIAKELVEKNPRLLYMDDDVGDSPLLNSILSENKELVWYFSLITRVEYASLPRILRNLSQTGLLDVSLYFFQKYPELALDEETALLFLLASNPSHFFSRSSLGFFKRRIYKIVPVNMEEILESIELGSSTPVQPRSFVAQVFRLFKRLLWKAIAQVAPSIKVVRDMKLKHECAIELVRLVCKQLSSKELQATIHFLANPNPIMSTALANGIKEIVVTLLQFFPELINQLVIPQRNILQAAIEYRQEKIVNIIKEISPMHIKNLCKTVREPENNTTLHLAGKLAPAFKLHSVSGAALQMQRELQWFKAVEKITPLYLWEQKNSKKKTAKEVFWEAHKGLATKGEKWMNDTANSYMVVSTLIATVLFAAAFTVPGGDVNDKGTPVFLWADAFMLFAILDAVSLFFSLTSLLMFLAILTARYAVDDFLKSLPKKLIIGLGSLFVAISAMIIAFGATLTIVLNEMALGFCANYFIGFFSSGNICNATTSFVYPNGPVNIWTKHLSCLTIKRL